MIFFLILSFWGTFGIKPKTSEQQYQYIWVWALCTCWIGLLHERTGFGYGMDLIEKESCISLGRTTNFLAPFAQDLMFGQRCKWEGGRVEGGDEVGLLKVIYSPHFFMNKP